MQFNWSYGIFNQSLVWVSVSDSSVVSVASFPVSPCQLACIHLLPWNTLQHMVYTQ